MDDKNQLVEIAVGVTKRLGDCTWDELDAAGRLLSFRSTHNQATRENLSVGRPPKCDWRAPDGQYCENDAETRTTGDDDAEGLCSEHAPS